MTIEKLLSAWEMSDKGKSIPLSHTKVIAELEVICPQKHGQDLLNQLVLDQWAESNCHGEYILTKKGEKLRAKLPGRVQPMLSVNKRTGKEWNRFRKILGYYIDCVHLQERRQEYLFNSEQNKYFFVPVLPLHWLKDLGEKSTVKIPLRQAQESAAKLFLTRKDDDEEIYIGYPISAFLSKNGETCYSPIGLIPVDITSYNKTELQFELRLDEAEINQNWLEYTFPKEKSQALFNCILRLHCNDEHRGKVDLKNALPMLQKNIEFAPDNLELNLPTLRGDEPNRLCNCAVLFMGQSLLYSKTLKRELKYIKDNISDEVLDSTALAYIFREPILPSQKDTVPCVPLPFIDANPEQMAAIEDALNLPSVKITGPPGTGKSQVAVNIIANLIFNGKNVLFSSKNHKAIEAIWARSQQVLNKPGMSLVNFCTKQDPNPWYKQDLDILMAGADSIDQREINNAFLQVKSQADRWRHITKNYESRLAALMKYEEWQHSCTEKNKAMRCVFASIDCDTISKQELKLLGKNIAKLGEEPELCLRKTLKYLKWKLYGKVKNDEARLYLQTKYPELLKDAINIWELKENFAKYNILFQEYSKILVYKDVIKKRIRNLPDIHDGEKKLSKVWENITTLLKPALLSCRCRKIQELSSNPELVNRLKNIMTFMTNAKSPAFFQRLKTEEAQQAEAGFKIFSKFYPGWAVTLLSLTKASPCIAHLFDSVIIDEASQCDQASVIPALFRAKSVVFIGDSKQFPPVINMRHLRNDYLKNKNKIDAINEQRFDFLTNSAYDLSSVCPILLKEHFRCASEIAEYFNEAYYDNKLRIRTDDSKLKTPVCMGYHHAVEWIDIPNSKNGELKAADEILQKLIKNRYNGSIGVITPFREYVNALKEVMYNPSLNEDKLLISTANGFQGGERDVIILVLGYNDALSKGQFWYVESPENRYIYNVAVSRARACLIIIGDRKKCLNSQVYALQHLAKLPHKAKKDKIEASTFESPWEEKFFAALEKAGIKTKPQYPLAGRRLDLAYISEKIKIDIEIDGIHYHTTDDGRRKMDDIYRDLQIQAIGWQVQRFWVYELQDNITACVKKIKEMINTTEITP